MFPCHAHPLPGLIPVTSEALHPRMMKGEQQRVKKGQRWGSLRLGETCTHAQAHRPQRRPPALALATSHSRTFNKSPNSLGGAPHCAAFQAAQLGSYETLYLLEAGRSHASSERTSLPQIRVIRAPSVKDEVPAPWHQLFAKKKKKKSLGVGWGVLLVQFAETAGVGWTGGDCWCPHLLLW